LYNKDAAEFSRRALKKRPSFDHSQISKCLNIQRRFPASIGAPSLSLAQNICALTPLLTQVPLFFISPILLADEYSNNRNWLKILKGSPWILG